MLNQLSIRTRLAILAIMASLALLVASHVETQGLVRHEEPHVASHRVIPAQAGIQACPQRTAV